MAKDVNIHVKTTGAQQTKQDIEGVSRSTEKLGHTTEQTGSKSSRAFKWITDGLKSLIGPLGFAAIAITIAAVAGKIAKFFDDLKTRCDEAVRNVQGIRKEFADLFEAMDAFDEKRRQQITKETAALLKEIAVSRETGLPVINAYVRQFRGMVESGQLTEEQYQQGLRGMLGYGERHGGAATPELVALMAGWGMVTPEQQGVFRRQIAAGAAASGLTDAELIGALGRGMPTIKAMGWTPAQAVETIAVLAAGEVGRKRASLPATTLQGLMAPQEANIAKLGISEAVAQDPQKLLAQLQIMRGQMSQQKFTNMLTDIYGIEAAAGVSKLLTAPRGGISGVIAKAATAEAVAAEQQEERLSKATQERRDARTKATAMEEDLNIKTKEQYEEDIREIGEAARKRFRRRRPVRQWIEELFTVGEEKEKEMAAFHKWEEELTPEERAAINEKYISYAQRTWQAWARMMPQERYEALTQQTPSVVNIHYHRDTIYTPRIGSDLRGPRAAPGALE